MAFRRYPKKQFHFALLILLVITLILIFVSGLWGGSSSLRIAAKPRDVRDPWLWPFASSSIWNHPIGSQASYHPAQLPQAKGKS